MTLDMNDSFRAHIYFANQSFTYFFLNKSRNFALMRKKFIFSCFPIRRNKGISDTQGKREMSNNALGISYGIISGTTLFNSPAAPTITSGSASVFAHYFSFLRDLFDIARR